MPLSQLSPKKLLGAIKNGCHHIIEQQDILNNINVFPVADGDTGSNLGSTALSVIQLSRAGETIEETLASVAEASLIGARGNSGIIFSQFLNGFHDYLGHTEQSHIDNFASLLELANRSVRRAIAEPVEGTMLTIMDTWARLVSDIPLGATELEKQLVDILPALKLAVEDTKHTLKVLEDSDVVDAGALGFYHFAYGFSHYLHAPVELEAREKPIDIPHPPHQHDVSENPPCHRYCTEGIIRGEDLDKEAIGHTLSSFGDSLVVSGSQNLCRFHIHTSTPEHVYSKMIEVGTVKYPKVDDMLRQFEMIHQQKHRIALVMDSSADIPKAWIDEHQIHVLPLNMHLDEHDLLDGYSFEANTFYNTLSTLEQYPKTSLPAQSVIENKLGMLSDQYDDVIIITLAKALSGTHDAINTIAKRHSNIHVIDSKTSTGAEGLLVNFTGELIAAGHEVGCIIKEVKAAVEKVHVFVAVEQFDSLVRSGRISSFKGKIAQFAGIKPIITLCDDGKGVVCAKAMNTPKAMVKLISLIKERSSEQGKTIKEYCIVHAGVEEKASSFANLTTEAFSKKPLYTEQVSTAIGLHAGLGAVAICAMID